MQESKEARERAVAALAEMERKIKDLEAETNRLIEDAQARGEKDKQALIEEGRKMVSDIQSPGQAGRRAGGPEGQELSPGRGVDCWPWIWPKAGSRKRSAARTTSAS